MQRVLLIDAENTIFSATNFFLKLLSTVAKEFNLSENLIIPDKVYNSSYKQLFNDIFKNVSWFKRKKIYRSFKNKLKIELKDYLFEQVKKDNVYYLIKELDEIKKLNAFNIVFSVCNSETKHFLMSSVFLKETEVFIDKKSIIYWRRKDKDVSFNSDIDYFAYKNIAVNQMIVMSNNLFLLRYANSFGSKTISFDIKDEEQKTSAKMFSNAEITDVLKSNLIATIEEILPNPFTSIE